MKKSDVAGKMAIKKGDDWALDHWVKNGTYSYAKANKYQKIADKQNGKASLNSTGHNEGESMMLPKNHNNRS